CFVVFWVVGACLGRFFFCFLLFFVSIGFGGGDCIFIFCGFSVFVVVGFVLVLVFFYFIKV
ncbi:hypothetical protein ACQWG0_24765, partial [Salmonella enterica subsp. enterica serovar Infantis]